MKGWINTKSLTDMWGIVLRHEITITIRTLFPELNRAGVLVC